MSHTQEIAREDWESFLNHFSEDHREVTIRMEVSDDTLGAQPVAGPLALLGLGLETKGSEQDGIDISLQARGSGGVMNHRIQRPTRVYLLEDAESGADCLSIEDADHRATRIFVPTLH
ncbi:MAG TPA: DUF5335 family protein [Myxococcaceae bacterium]|nr:DUF5335 family protein [Myxococcaceae bacterium]